MHVPDLRFGHAPLPAAAPGYDPAGDALALIAPGTPSPAPQPIPGDQDFDSLGAGHRFVVRVPAAWNGDLVVCGTPATRSECANDATLGDFLLARGYAFATSNKGIPYNAVLEPAQDASDPAASYPIPFDDDGSVAAGSEAVLRLGALTPQALDVAAWHVDLANVTRAAKDRIRSGQGREPRRTYALGLSIGGGQVRYLLERFPELIDGGIEWASVFWDPDQNLLTSLPPFLRNMPAYRAVDRHDATAHAAIVAAGFPPDRRGTMSDHRSLWDDHYASPPFYTDLTVFAFAKLLDPLAGSLDSLERRAAYRPSHAARARIATFAHTGALERPLIGIAGDADVLVPPQHHAAPYFDAVCRAGRAQNYCQYVVTGGPHVDAYANFGYGLVPQVPFVWRAFERLVVAVEAHEPLPGAGTVRSVHTPLDIV